MKTKDILDDYMMVDIPKDDINETILQSKKILRQAPIQKHETNTIRQMKLIMHYHFPKLFILQAILTVIILSMSLSVLSEDYGKLYFILIIGSVLFSMISAVEIIRNRMNDMWETERVCTIRIEKIIAYKLFVLSITTFISICLIAMILSLTHQNISIFKIFATSLLPYMIITTCIIQLKDHLETIQGILIVYVGMTMFFVLIYLNQYFIFYQSQSIFIFSFIICMLLNIWKLKPKES
ncbi:hypothetical protein [Absiella sp. AM29-15]|uniref:hypothetical protein n=1 Tax=Absiella sp. AM29-15 TaxID=2292278 RepID=UPI000E42A155|nr:hypothetical protein [Absiella sp. AM29-15]RGC53833.1 hypothetical protein DW761_00885 [Absiella sp. AM29-15]